MLEILAELQPLNVSTGTRPTIRLTSTQNTAATGQGGNRWWPAITRKPILAMQLFEGAFTGETRTGGAAFEVNVNTLLKADPQALTYRWPGALVTLRTINVNTGAVVDIFSGEVERHEIANRTLKIEASVRTRQFDSPVLTATYAGTGGAEGSADLKGRVKPLAIGAPRNVEPVLIDAVNNVYQLNGYGSIQGLPAVYERASSFGSPTTNVANYAALVALNIPPGRWATCLAEGMFRLGAPAAGLITADVQGRNVGVWARLPGEIIRRVANLAGVSDSALNLTSLSTLSVAAPYNMSLYLTDQTTVMDVARAIASQCNAVAGVSWLGSLFISRAATIGSPVSTFEIPARRRPVALSSVEKPTSAPFWRIEMQAARCWRVHRPDEIAFTGDLVDRGEWDPAETYREGHVVDQSAAGSVRWIYINPTPTAGNTPPTWPSVSNAFWEVHTPPTGWSGILNDGGKPADNATVGAPAGTDVAGTPASTVASGANAANAGVNSDGTIKSDKVGSAAVVLNAVADLATFFRTFTAGTPLSSSAITDIVLDGVALSMTITNPSASAARIVVTWNLSISQGGGTTDAVTFVLRRSNPPEQIGGAYPNTHISSGSSGWAAISLQFTTDVAANTTQTVTLMAQSNDSDTRVHRASGSILLLKRT